MAKMNKISSFQTFSEVREAENADKLQQENQAKRLELTESCLLYTSPSPRD